MPRVGGIQTPAAGRTSLRHVVGRTGEPGWGGANGSTGVQRKTAYGRRSTVTVITTGEAHRRAEEVYAKGRSIVAFDGHLAVSTAETH